MVRVVESISRLDPEALAVAWLSVLALQKVHRLEARYL
jgi:hypothetical protein